MSKNKNRYSPILAVDFDGTITKTNNYPNKPKKEDLQEYCQEVLTELHKKDCIIILWTCRTGEQLQDAIDFCKEMNIPIDYVNENCDRVKAVFQTSPKIFANYYIDDLNIGGFIGWQKVKEIVNQDKYFKTE